MNRCLPHRPTLRPLSILRSDSIFGLIARVGWSGAFVEVLAEGAASSALGGEGCAVMDGLALLHDPECDAGELS